MDLYCNRNNPENIRATGADYILQIVLFSIGGVFFLVGFIIGIITIKKDKLRKNLLQNGRPLVAIVEQIDFDYLYSVNRRHPYVIYCTYNNSIIDVTYRFKSEHIWGDPERYYPVGSEIIVMVDPNDYSKYYVKVENNERDYN